MQSAVARSNSDAAVSGISTRQQGSSACWQYSKGTSYIIAPISTLAEALPEAQIWVQHGATAATAGGCGRVLPAHMIACAFSHTMLCCLVASTSAPAYAPCSA